MIRDMSLPIIPQTKNALQTTHKPMSTDEVVARLHFVKQTKNFLTHLLFRLTYMGETLYSERVSKHLRNIDTYDGALAEELSNWVHDFERIKEHFEKEHKDELEFLEKSRNI